MSVLTLPDSLAAPIRDCRRPDADHDDEDDDDDEEDDDDSSDVDEKAAPTVGAGRAESLSADRKDRLRSEPAAPAAMSSCDFASVSPDDGRSLSASSGKISRFDPIVFNVSRQTHY